MTGADSSVTPVVHASKLPDTWYGGVEESTGSILIQKLFDAADDFVMHRLQLQSAAHWLSCFKSGKTFCMLS